MEIPMGQETNNKYYIYPDRQDYITASLIRDTENYQDYWHKSEEQILKQMLNKIKKNSYQSRLLDAGCGYGRLTMFFSPYFNEIIAVEPDSERYNVCMQNLEEWNLTDKVKLYQCEAEKLDMKNFDIILCSHVFQHIPEQKAEYILQTFRKMLKKDGLLFITTTHSIDGEISYRKSYIDSNDRRIEESINQKDFNQLDNIDGVLPIKFYTYKHIKKLLNENKFEVIDYKVYHDKNGSILMDSVFGIDKMINRNLDIQEKNGRDLYVCAIPQ